MPEAERSEEVEEILGRTPSWPLRWGSGIILFLLIALFTSFWWVHYPETVEGRAVLVRDKVPVKGHAPLSGNVGRLFVGDGQRVEKGEELLFVGEEGKRKSALRMERFAVKGKGRLEKGRPPALPAAPEPVDEGVDEAWERLRRRSAAYKDIFERLKEGGEKGLFRLRLRELKGSLRSLEEQERILREDLALSEKKLRKKRELHAERAVAERELWSAEADRLQRKAALERVVEERAQRKSRILQMKRDRERRRNEREEERRKAEHELELAIEGFLRRLREWKAERTIKAPKDGRLYMIRGLGQGDRVEGDEPLLAVVPEDGKFIARVELPVEKAAGVEKGDRVRLSLDDHPEEEVGVLRGEVRKRSPFPVDEKVPLQVELREGLHTTHGEELPPQERFSGTAELVVRERRLFYRILAP